MLLNELPRNRTAFTLVLGKKNKPKNKQNRTKVLICPKLLQTCVKNNEMSDLKRTKQNKTKNAMFFSLQSHVLKVNHLKKMLPKFIKKMLSFSSKDTDIRQWRCNTLLQEMCSCSFLLAVLQSLSVWPPLCCLWTCVCVCAWCMFPTALFIDNLFLDLLLGPSALPLLSVHPFLHVIRSVSMATLMNSDLPVCLFISRVSQVQRVGQQARIYRQSQLGVNKICYKHSSTEKDLAQTGTPICQVITHVEFKMYMIMEIFLSHICRYCWVLNMRTPRVTQCDQVPTLVWDISRYEQLKK